jgi:hypothetical protein
MVALVDGKQKAEFRNPKPCDLLKLETPKEPSNFWLSLRKIRRKLFAGKGAVLRARGGRMEGYEKIRKIGSGAMGVCWLVRRKLDGGQVCR